MNFDSKENGEKKLILRNQSINIIPMRRISLGCPIMKRKEIIIKMHVYLNLMINFDSKENGRKKSFCYKTEASISFIPMKGIIFIVPNHEKKRDYYKNLCLS